MGIQVRAARGEGALIINEFASYVIIMITFMQLATLHEAPQAAMFAGEVRRAPP